MSLTTNITQTNNNTPFMSQDLMTLLNTINLAILSGIVSTFGIATNIINILVFIKQGFRETVNITLLALAVSDLCSLLTLQFVNLMRNPLFIDKMPFIADEFQHLTGGWPHSCFVRTTSWITMYLTVERCLCVLLPLQVKQITRPNVVICVLVFIYVIMILAMVPDYATCYIGWKFDAARNQSLLGLLFLPSRNVYLVALSFYLSACTQISAFAVIIIFTAILVFKLKQTSQWRQSMANNGQNSMKGAQKRDSKIVKMVILIAVIYCLCLFSFLVNCIVTCIEPEFMAFRLYHNFFFGIWSFAFLFESINASVNIFVYYKMSSKYRTTLQLLVAKKS